MAVGSCERPLKELLLNWYCVHTRLLCFLFLFLVSRLFYFLICGCFLPCFHPSLANSIMDHFRNDHVADFRPWTTSSSLVTVLHWSFNIGWSLLCFLFVAHLLFFLSDIYSSPLYIGVGMGRVSPSPAPKFVQKSPVRARLDEGQSPARGLRFYWGSGLGLSRLSSGSARGLHFYILYNIYVLYIKY